jgi:23S rRNA pseudouridine1911/1915/1917 synthase
MEDGKAMIKVIYEDNHLLVVEKPINIPVQADDSGDLDFLTMLKDYIRNKYNKPGNVYLGLVHRLDRPVGGIMVFAKTSKAASRLGEQIRTRQFQKEYLAVVLGKLDKQEDTLVDNLYKDTKHNMVVVSDKGKEAILSYKVIKFKDNLSLVKILLTTGRSHQIRVQFSSRNHPLYGDQRYNKDAKVGEQIALWAYKVSFIHPTTKKPLTLVSSIPNTSPWKKFIDDIGDIE